MTLFMMRWPKQRLKRAGGRENVLLHQGAVERSTWDGIQQEALIRRFWWPGVAYEVALIERGPDGDRDKLILQRLPRPAEG